MSRITKAYLQLRCSLLSLSSNVNSTNAVYLMQQYLTPINWKPKLGICDYSCHVIAACLCFWYKVAQIWLIVCYPSFHNNHNQVATIRQFFHTTCINCNLWILLLLLLLSSLLCLLFAVINSSMDVHPTANASVTEKRWSIINRSREKQAEQIGCSLNFTLEHTKNDGDGFECRWFRVIGWEGTRPSGLSAQHGWISAAVFSICFRTVFFSSLSSSGMV